MSDDLKGLNSACFEGKTISTVHMVFDSCRAWRFQTKRLLGTVYSMNVDGEKVICSQPFLTLHYRP